MIPTLSQVCSLNSLFHQDIEDYAAGHCRSVEIWMTKLEQFIEARSMEAARKLLRENEVVAPVASFQGGLLTSQGTARKESWELFSRRLDLCRSMEIETLVLANDIQLPFGSTELERMRVSLRQAAQEAERYDRRVALEFQGRAAFGNNLQTAVALIEEVGSLHLGICLDVFHFAIGPSKLIDLSLLSCDNLFHVQLCDLVDVPRELATDADRILPGDGDLPLDAVIDRLQSIGYTGCVSVELMNPQIWQVPARQFGEIAMTALRKTLGQAKMA
jgi:4-hydroxyphenylpyruvate dioxygenase